MSRHKTPMALVVASLLALAALATGCGDDSTGTPTGSVAETSNGTTAPDTTASNTTASNTTTSNTTVATATLERLGDQTQNMNANSAIALQVRYTAADGTLGANEAIDWKIVGEPNGTQLDARQDTTDNDGISEMTVRSAVMEATFEVEATVASDPDVPAVRFTISVQSKEFASYRVVVNYDGVRNYANNNIKVTLFDDVESCDDIMRLRPPTAFRADQRRPDANWPPMTFLFDNLRNETRYVVVAAAYADGNDQVIGSWGCNDDRPEIVDGQTPPDIIVEMTDTTPIVTGTWQIESQFNLTEALPGSVLTYLNPILDFFNDPAGTLTSLLFDFLADQFGLDAGGVQDLVENIASELVEQLLESNETVADVLNAGGDISEILRNFRLRGEIVITPEMVGEAQGGVLPLDGVTLTYTQFGYRWQLLCEDGEFEENPSCGDAVVDFGNVGLTPAAGIFDAAIIPNDDFNIAEGRIWFHQLAVQAYTLDLNYGQIVLYLIEKLALPTLLGDPSIDSLSALLRSFIDCADLFGEDSFFEPICEASIDEVSNLATDFLSDQTLEYDRFTIQTPDAEPCALIEQDDADYGAPAMGNTAHDPRFKFMGFDEPNHPDYGDRRCKWGARLQFSDDPADATEFTGTFHAEKLFD